MYHIFYEGTNDTYKIYFLEKYCTLRGYIYTINSLRVQKIQIDKKKFSTHVAMCVV